MSSEKIDLPAPRPRAVIHSQLQFYRVMVSFDREDLAEYSLESCVFELKRRNLGLTDIQILDYSNNLPAGQRSQQCQAVYDAVFAAGLRDPILEAANHRRY